MVDLAQALSEIKSLPDQELHKALKSPSGSIPGWLALGEIHERKRMRASTGGGAEEKRPSMAEEYAGSIQPIIAGAGMEPPPPQQGMPPGGTPPGGIAALPPPSQGIASMPQAQGYWKGGLVSSPNVVEDPVSLGFYQSLMRQIDRGGEDYDVVEAYDNQVRKDKYAKIREERMKYPQTEYPIGSGDLGELQRATFDALDKKQQDIYTQRYNVTMPPFDYYSQYAGQGLYNNGGIVGLANGGVISYANQNAIRNQMLNAQMQAYLQDAITNVYGPGYTAQVYSGGQSGDRRTGSVRHNEGRAGDVYVLGPDGQRLTGDALAPLGQYWSARKYGGVGMEMHGGGIHLDDWATPPQGGGMAWDYAKQGGRYTPAQAAAINAGLQGQMPALYGQPQGGFATMLGGQQIAGGGGQNMLAGGSAQDQIVAGLVRRGMPQHIAQGFAMNFRDESGFNPGIQEANPTSGRGGFGLYQLTGPRRVAYENYAKGLGVPLDNTDAQLDFMMGELGSTEKNAAALIYAQPDANHAAAAIVNNFLRPAPEYAAMRTANYLSGNVPAYAAPVIDPNAAVAATAGATASNMAGAESAAGGDAMSQFMLMQQMAGKGGAGQQRAAPPPSAPSAPAQPVDANQFVQNPGFMMRRRSYGLA